MVGLLAGAFAEVGVLTLGVGFAVIALLTYRYRARLADHLDLGPAVDVIEHVRPGLTAKEVEEFLTLHQEYGKMQEEKREEIQKEAKQNTGSGRTLNTR